MLPPPAAFWRATTGGHPPHGQHTWPEDAPASRPTLLDVVDQCLQLRVGLGLLPKGVQEGVVLRGAGHVRLPQPPLQQADLGLLLGHLQPLREKRWCSESCHRSLPPGFHPGTEQETLSHTHTPAWPHTLSMEAFRKLSSSSRASAREQELITTEVSVESSSS